MYEESIFENILWSIESDYESSSVWHHTLLGFYLCQSRRLQTCLQY